MRKSTLAAIIAVVMVLSLIPFAAFAKLGATSGIFSIAEETTVNLVTQAAKTKPMNLKPQYSAYWTNGKGLAYKNLTSKASPFFGQPVVHKAQISGDTLYLWGKYRKTSSGKVYNVKRKAFKLTSQTKFYHHVGNGNFFENYSKSKMKKLLSSKSSKLGGDISFSMKNGKVTMLIAQ